MSEEGFFKRWSRLKSSGPEAVPELAPRPAAPPVPAAAPAASPAPEAEAAPAPLPTLEDAARLTPDADFSVFVAKGVDQSVRRLALKKLFADPHFNAIDGLDIYMNDYNKASPLTPAMLASLKHAQGLVTRLLDDRQQEAEAAAQAVQAAQVADPQPDQERALREAPPSTPQGNA